MDMYDESGCHVAEEEYRCSASNDSRKTSIPWPKAQGPSVPSTQTLQLNSVTRWRTFRIRFQFHFQIRVSEVFVVDSALLIR
ncbi:hypothetical protein PIB30_056104 [Stylosanthes scabra]|uniref:Uncharacterized protein n=1 Tax=Stylosanthes scabra TaxID=79078 RepID=A0ABU6YKE5_9FABA|nr:hypothetical protein [Stylosanthes scabra]